MTIRLKDQIEELENSFEAQFQKMKEEKKKMIDKLWEAHVKAGTLRQDILFSNATMGVTRAL